MWLHPRATVRELLNTSSLQVELLLAAGSGILQSIVQGISNNVGVRFSSAMIVLSTVVLGATWGLLQLHVFAVTLYLVGRWTGAPAQFRHLRTALAWAAVPQVAMLPFWLLGTLVFGRFLYVDPQAAMARMPAVLAQVVLALATLVCCGWWLVLEVFAVAEVQRVSAWRALGNFVAAALVCGVVVVLLVLVVAFINRG